MARPRMLVACLLVPVLAVLGLVALYALAWFGPSLYDLFLPTQSLGGGTRLVYALELEGGEVAGEELLTETVEILRDRLDRRRTRGVRVRADEAGYVVVDVPRDADRPQFGASLWLTAELDEEASALTAEMSVPGGTDGSFSLREFPNDGGVVRIGNELIRYTLRLGNDFTGLERGFKGTTAVLHPGGAKVELEGMNRVRRFVECTGGMELYLLADPDRDFPAETNWRRERAKVDDWLAAHPAQPIGAYNATAPEDGGPPGDLRWLPLRLDDYHGIEYGESAAARLAPVVRQVGRERFTEEDVLNFMTQQSNRGEPEILVEWRRRRRGAFEDWVRKHRGRELAFVVGGEIVCHVEIDRGLAKECVLFGGPTRASRFAVGDMLVFKWILRSDRLPARPALVREEHLAASPRDD